MSQTVISRIFNHPRDDICLISADSGTQLTFGQLHDYCLSLSKYLSQHLPPASVIILSVPFHQPDAHLLFVVCFLSILQGGHCCAPLNPKLSEKELEYYIKDTSAKAILTFECLDQKDSYYQNYSTLKQLSKDLKLGFFKVSPKSNSGFPLSFGQNNFSIQTQNPVLTQKPEHQILTPQTICLKLHTSGTTSKPKCVPLSQGNLSRTMENLKQTYQLSPKDRCLVIMPLFHVHGLIGCFLSSLGAGGSAVVTSFSASKFSHTFQRYQCTWYSAVPTMHQLILKQLNEKDLPFTTLRFIRSCSSALSPTLYKQLESTFHVPILEAYAMTEAAHQMTSFDFNKPRLPGSVGYGQGVEIGILLEDHKVTFEPEKIGEIVIRGENVTLGYENRPEANKDSFFTFQLSYSPFNHLKWFRTGDQGYFHPKTKSLVLTGRLKELINRGGEKIAPLELDHLLQQHPAVHEAICFGLPHSLYGEEVYAAVVLKEKPTNEAAYERKILKFINEKTAAFKCPKRIFIVDQLPKTATGKVQRRNVAAFIQKQFQVSKL